MANQELSLMDLPRMHLVSAFRAMEHPDCLIALARKCGGGEISEGIQRFIWENCISKADEKSHTHFLQKFLKKLIREVESSGGGVLDEFYEQYANYMASLKDEHMGKGNAWIFKYISFIFRDGVRSLVVSLRCSFNMLEGDTGCSLWPSGLFLSEFILSFPEIFSNKSCLEVGSGVGLVGICLKHAKASEVVLSDGDLSSLANLKHNLELNHINSMDRVKCISLLWESAKESELRVLKPDIVLASDVLYNPACFPHLVRVLSVLLDRTSQCCSHQKKGGGEFVPAAACKNGYANGAGLEGGPTNSDDDHKCKTISLPGETKPAAFTTDFLYHQLESGPVAFVSNVIRNIDTFNYFMVLANQADLDVSDITEAVRPDELLPYMQSYPRGDVRLLLISHLNN